MTKKTILVLDDEPWRVRYLQEQLGEGVEIHHAFYATEVAKRLGIKTGTIDDEILRHTPSIEPSSYDLLILDHDLGTRSDGADACDLLPEDFATPVLVWSFNPVGAKEMMTILERKRIVAHRYPCGPDAVRCVREILYTA